MRPLFALPAIATASALICFSVLGPSALGPFEDKTRRERTAPPLSYLSPHILKIVTLGHYRVYEDLLWLWLIQELIPAEFPEKQTLSPELARLKVANTIRQKPEIGSVYLFSCLILAFKAGRPESCASVSDTGLRAVPEDWRIPATQGYIEGFLLRQPLRAAFYYHKAAQHPKAPAFARSLAEKFLRQKNPDAENMESEAHDLKQLPGWDLFRKFSDSPSESDNLSE